MAHGSDLRSRSTELRKQGLSLGEISSRLGIAKSTASVWTSHVVLDQLAIDVLTAKKLKAWQVGIKTLQKARDSLKNEIALRAKRDLDEIILNRQLSKLICSIFIWTEGAKISSSWVGFMNSDPKMISTFLTLFRRSFNLDPAKFRALIHVHQYHDEPVTKSFWSKITHIPLSQFTKSYLKPNTGKRVRENYMGSIAIRYYDYRIALELKSTYNLFSESLGM